MLLAVRDAPAARIVTFECPRTLRGSVRMLRSPGIRRKVSFPRRMIGAKIIRRGKRTFLPALWEKSKTGPKQSPIPIPTFVEFLQHSCLYYI